MGGNGPAWTKAEIDLLVQTVAREESIQQLATTLDRLPSAVRAKTGRLKLRSPSNT